MKKQTPFLKKEDFKKNPRKWHLVDAEGQTLGRLSTKIATLLRGKHNPKFTAHLDSGDCVIVINAKKVVLSGNKDTQKTYYWHTGYPGGIKQTTFSRLLEKKPCDIIYRSVKGMMPKNALHRQSIRKLKIYEGSEHPHHNQKPQLLNISKS